ncbi:phosphoribosyltransferase [Pelomicrobium sp.]|jgi:predicted phosphoribosyltransferase|uniref:phosphoribosyltransferase n=1 Tax=Pelomicrobium sp. TaxID=2815319 RepID=UPI002FDE8C15
MIFENRIDAARRLAAALAQYRGARPLVLAIPRGAIEMGRVLADALDGELDVVLVTKLRAPFSPEFAVGAVDESGWTYVADYAARVGADPAYLEAERRRQLEILQARRHKYTPARQPIDPAGRTVIVVDDGLATGATMIAALHAVRAKKPAWLVCAVPVAARDSLDKVGRYADEVVCLHAPEDFGAVSAFYLDFPQVDDDTVAALLAGRKPARVVVEK